MPRSKTVREIQQDEQNLTNQKPHWNTITFEDVKNPLEDYMFIDLYVPGRILTRSGRLRTEQIHTIEFLGWVLLISLLTKSAQ